MDLSIELTVLLGPRNEHVHLLVNLNLKQCSIGSLIETFTVSEPNPSEMKECFNNYIEKYTMFN